MPGQSLWRQGEMYETFYNLAADPFRLSPDHHFCFDHRSFAKARAHLAYAFMRAEGFIMLTGRPGTGKTTLVGELIENLPDDKVVTATLVCTQVKADDLLKMVAYNFDVEANLLSKAELLQRLTVRLCNLHREGRRALLVVDEAHSLTFSAMEELRLLTNIQADGVPLLQVLLLGQPELRELMLSPKMEQVHERIVGASHIENLEPDETEAYIRYRLKKVGWQGDPAISTKVYPLIHNYSDGVPRRVNLICSRLFLSGYIKQRHEIGIRDVREVLLELQDENLVVGPALSEFDFEGDDEFESPPPFIDTHAQTAPDPATSPADSSSPSVFDAPSNIESSVTHSGPSHPDPGMVPSVDAMLQARANPQPQYDSQELDDVVTVNSPDPAKGRRGVVARRGVIVVALFAFLIALVLTISRYGAGVDVGELWRKLAGGLLVSENKPLKVTPAAKQPDQVLPQTNEVPSGGTGPAPPVPENNEEAPLQQDEGSIHDDPVADGDTLVESVPEGDGDGEQSSLLTDDFRPSPVEIDSVHTTATTRSEDKSVTDSSGAASQDVAPPEEPSPDSGAAGQQSLAEESVESGAESEAHSSLLPAPDAADTTDVRVRQGVEPPREQVLRPSAKTIYQIDFDIDSVDLTGDAHRMLDRAIDKMNLQASSAALVRGFSDGTGSKSYQQELSGGRVAAVLAYMDAAGIESQRLQVADAQQSVQEVFNPATGIEQDRSKIQTVQISVAWIERD